MSRWLAIDARPRIEAVLEEVTAMCGKGLVSLERARLLTGDLAAVEPPETQHEATKLTVYVGRQQRPEGSSLAYLAVVDLLHRRGIAGATVLLGVDGTAHGLRHRARFFGRNKNVPLMIIAVGGGDRIAVLLPELGTLLDRPLVTLERIRVCKRDGLRLADPSELTGSDPSGLRIWQKLMVYASEQARHAGRPLYLEIIHRLREAGAAGATALRGSWGYHGDHPPQGDRLWSLRRHVPVVTVIVDTPERIQRWFRIVDELTETGLVTSEMVPALRAGASDTTYGGLRLSRSRGF